MHAVPMEQSESLYGLLAEYADASTLVAASRRVREEGYTVFDAYTPYPVAALDEAMAIQPTRIPMWVLLGALIGGVTAYGMQYYAAVIDYPWNVGGKPLHSWPAFIPITFELAVLGGALFGLIAMIVKNRLPEPYHPLFDVPAFDQASQHAFFLCIEASDPRFDREQTRQFLQALGAKEVTEVVA